MKPIKLKIKGLNSFIEEQTIDFEKLTDRGLFGIFGPTGSGKSTILDGITLALYGDVSRKSSNYINTNCERLNVSFEFQISGSEIKRYIVEREFKRKNKEFGNPISGKCKIIDITNSENKILADKVGTVTKKVEEIIGLNLDDFTRTVVLPQGKFSEFLKLEGKERREMLERLFNLQKYGDNLSRKLSSKISKEKTDNSILIGKLSSYENINEEILIENENELKILNDKLKNLKEEVDIIEKKHKEDEEVWNLRLELKEYELKKTRLKEREKEIEIYTDKIKLGESGIKVLPYIKAYENTIKEFNKYKVDLENFKVEIEKINKEKLIKEDTWNLAKENKENKLPSLILKEQKIEDALEDKKILDEILKSMESLEKDIKISKNKSEEYKIKILNNDQEINGKNIEIKETEVKVEKLKIDPNIKDKVQQGIIEEQRYNNLNLIIKKNKKKIESVEEEKRVTIVEGKKLKEILDNKINLLKEYETKLEKLVKDSPGEQKDLLDLQELLVESKEKWNSYHKLNKDICLSKEGIEELNRLISSKTNDEQILKKTLEQLKKQYNDASMENLAIKLRKQLKDGDTCPVCGSIHHIKEEMLYEKDRNLEVMEEEIENKEKTIKLINQEITINETKINSLNDKIKLNEDEIDKLGTNFRKNTIEELENKFKILKTALENYIKEKENLEKNINIISNEISIEDGKINALRAVVRNNNKQLEELKNDTKENLNELCNIKNKLEELKAETLVEDFNKKNIEIKQIEKQRENLENRIKENRKLLELLEKNKEALKEKSIYFNDKLTKDKASLEGYEKNKNEKIELIKSKVGEEKNIEGLLSEIKNNIVMIKEKFDIAEKEKNYIEKRFNDCNEKLISTISKYEELRKRKDEGKVELELAIDNEGFRTIEDVKENILEKSQLDIYKENVDNYKNEFSKISGAIESLIKKINNRDITEEEWENINILKVKKKEELKFINEDVIKLEEHIRTINVKMDELKELRDKKKELDHKLALLGDLDKLFKGKKFVEFVAANQLKYVSIEASKRLKNITHGNYGLEVDDDGKFIIRDYKNGGAERDASTLSGGETFLASLALALALSAQIQLKGTAPLELFFLDEGFGTLDDDLLEVVISSLEKIHNDKLKVGIISHVESIKNRVPVKLIITPAESGIGGSKVKIDRS